MTRRQIWTIVVLISGYILCQLVADVAAVKIMDVWGLTMPAGTLIYAVTFTWRDVIDKRLGKEWARAAIVVAAVCNILMVLYFLFAIQLKPAVFWANQAAYKTVLGFTWRIALASIAAEVVSELVDTELYHVIKRRLGENRQWGRVLGSNAISCPLDSVVFATLAFGGTIPLSGLWGIVKGQMLFKYAITLLSLPGIYVVKERPLLRQPAYAAD